MYDEMYVNITASYTMKKAKGFDVMPILQIVIASVGICANFTVVFAFLNHKQLRRKVPNMFIINQVRCYDSFVQLLYLMREARVYLRYCGRLMMSSWTLRFSILSDHEGHGRRATAYKARLPPFPTLQEE